MYRINVSEHGRIADIAIVDNEGDVVEVNEVQLSPISIELLLARTKDYAAHGIECIWVFSEKMAKDPSVKAFALDYSGMFRTIKFTQQTISDE